MPVWYEKAQALAADGKLNILGVTQEQHPERCRLFAQWKQLDFPILLDQANILNLSAVPIIVALDEHGVVHKEINSPAKLHEFVTTEYDQPEETARPAALTPPHNDDPQAPVGDNPQLTGSSWRQYGDQLIVWHPHRRTAVIKAYERAIEADADDALAHFRLGVAHESRFESPNKQPGDFAAAIRQWRKALALDPNQYIWRRRIQQYGPRLDKPYPFYDWIEQARKEIAERGEAPVELRTALAGAEVARPSRKFAAEAAGANPDPDAKIHRDANQSVSIETASVLHTDSQVAAARVHVDLMPNDHSEWSADAGPLTVWMNSADGVSLSRHIVETSELASPTSLRRVEFEVRSGQGQLPDTLQGYALYYVCNKSDGECSYLRQDFEILLRR